MIQIGKATFLRKEVTHLGIIAASAGVNPNPDKRITFKIYWLVKTTKQIKIIIDFLQYYIKKIAKKKKN